MNKNSKKVNLNDGDKWTISKNLNICTDSHGKGCNLPKENEKNKKLN